MCHSGLPLAAANRCTWLPEKAPCPSLATLPFNRTRNAQPESPNGINMNPTNPVNISEINLPATPKEEAPHGGSTPSKPVRPKPPRTYEPLENTFSGFLLFLLISGVILLLVFWPWTFGSKSALQAPVKTEFLGQLQNISFVGGLRADTQIQTQRRTLLLHGVKNLRLGVVLETRVDFYGKFVCEVGTDNCYGFAGQD
jgi:hypothetical protein